VRATTRDAILRMLLAQREQIDATLLLLSEDDPRDVAEDDDDELPQPQRKPFTFLGADE
jgi:hypothetical protein